MSFESEVLRSFDAALRTYKASGATTCQIILAGKPIDCIPAPSPDATTLVAGGFIEDYQFSVTVRRDDCSAPPLSGDLVTYRGRLSKILKPENSEVSPLVILHCGTPDR